MSPARKKLTHIDGKGVARMVDEYVAVYSRLVEAHRGR